MRLHMETQTFHTKMQRGNKKQNNQPELKQHDFSDSKSEKKTKKKNKKTQVKQF